MSNILLNDFKEYVRSKIASLPSDVLLQSAIDAAEQGLNNACQRQFVVASASSARSYVPDGTAILRIHDCTTIVSVTVDGATLTSGTDFGTEPVNLLSWAGETRPIEQLRRFWLPWAWYQSIPGKATVSVTATWGWASIPYAVKEATRVLAKDIAANRDVQQGLVTVTDVAGVGMRENRYVASVIDDYRRVESFGI